MSTAAVSIIDLDIRREQLRASARSRAVFLSAYERFRELTHHYGIHAQDYESWGMGGSTPCLLNISDWLADFHLAGKETLRGREERLFCLHYMMGLGVNATMRTLDLHSCRAFYLMAQTVQEKLGVEIVRRGLWPVRSHIGIGYFD